MAYNPIETGLLVTAGPVSLYHFSLLPQHFDAVHQPRHPAHPGRTEAAGTRRLPQDVVHLSIEINSFVADGCHGF